MAESCVNPGVLGPLPPTVQETAAAKSPAGSNRGKESKHRGEQEGDVNRVGY